MTSDKARRSDAKIVSCKCFALRAFAAPLPCEFTTDDTTSDRGLVCTYVIIALAS